MYNRLYKHFCDHNILYSKQFDFQEKRINCSFEKKSPYELGIFIDLSKGFDTVDHKTLITNLQYYGVEETNLSLFKN